MNLPQFILQIPFLIGMVYLATGALLYFKPAKKPNGWYGYRTPSSMATQERWEFSQRYSALEMLRMGFLALLLSLSGYFFNFSEEVNMAISLSIFVLLILYPIISTERALRKKFPSEK